MEEEIAQLEEDVRSTSPLDGGGASAEGERASQTPHSALTPESPSICPSSSLLPPRSPRTPITLSAVTTSSAGVVGHSPSKMRRISQSPAPSPFRELQMDDVMSSVSDGVLLNGGGCASAASERRRVSASRLGVSGIHGSVEGALSIASSDVSSSVVDAVSLPPRPAVHSPAPIRAAPSEHSHLHSHLPKFHKPQPVHMTIGGGAMLPVETSK